MKIAVIILFAAIITLGEFNKNHTRLFLFIEYIFVLLAQQSSFNTPYFYFILAYAAPKKPAAKGKGGKPKDTHPNPPVKSN